MINQFKIFKGAGTILDVLKNKKPLLVVINDSLMNNHQNELYDVMTKEKFIFGLSSPKDLCSNVNFPNFIRNKMFKIFKLAKILENLKKGFLLEYPTSEKNIISKIIKDLYE